MLYTKIQEKKAILGVLGLGYVGLPLAVEKANAGFKTVGYDIQKDKVDLVNSGINYIGDILDDELKNLVETKRLSATDDISFVSKCDAVAICVPTPLDEHQSPDISYVIDSAESIVPFIHKDMIIILESTTYPGTTEELLKPILEKSGLICGKDFYLAFSPERVDPGNKIYNTKNTPKVVGGVTSDCGKIAALLYESILEAPVHLVSSPAVAEMEKILENTYRNVNIGLINELAILAHEMKIDIWEVIEAAKTKPYGFQAFYPGPGLGGHCIPLDPYYLSWKAREYGFHTTIIENSMVINDRMPKYTVDRCAEILNDNKLPLNGSKILVLGVAYKQDIDDYRESPALKVIEELEKRKTVVEFYDPHVNEFNFKGHRKIGLSTLTKYDLQSADLVLITTAHSNIDYEYVYNNSTLIFDTKNVMKDLKNRENLFVL